MAAFPQRLLGSFLLINMKNGQAMELSDTDKKIVACNLHGKSTQQWEFIPSGDGYIICSVQSKEYSLTVDNIKDGEQIIATRFPVAWSVYTKVQVGHECMLIAWAETPYALDLTENSGPIIKVKLAKRTADDLCQLWKYIPCMPAQPWGVGTYYLINVRGNTAMELHGEDKRSIVASPLHGETCQQWKFQPHGDGYVIQNMGEATRFMTLVNGMHNGASVVANSFPGTWTVKIDREENISIHWADTNILLELPMFANDVLGTNVQIWQNAHLAWQRWRFIQCA